MREEPHTVIAKLMSDPELRVELPDTPYALWARGELDRFLHIPDDGTQVEVIGREIVLSPPASIPHNRIAYTIQRAFILAGDKDPAFPWRSLGNSGVSLLGGDCGVIPDLVVTEEGVFNGATGRDFVGDEVELVVEVTSPSNAKTDREPERPPKRETKWEWYARAEIPYYLLVDPDPKIAQTTLYSIPDQGSAAYLHKESWDFGETITLPDPFSVEIPTTFWRPWSNSGDQE